jgi:hypothetical protein
VRRQPGTRAHALNTSTVFTSFSAGR